MEIFVDERRIDAAGVVNKSLEEALQHIQSTECPKGRLIVSLRCDGQEVKSSKMTEALGQPVDSVARLDVVTGSPGDLVEDAMSEACRSLDGAVEGWQRAAQLLNEGKTAEGIQSLGESVGVLQQLYDAVGKSIHMLEIDPEQVTIDGDRLISAITKPMEVLVQIKESLESQDHVQLADILQYELEETTRLWYAIIARMREAADEHNQQVNASHTGEA